MSVQPAARNAARPAEEQPEQVVGRDADGAKIAPGEGVAARERPTAEFKLAFEETAGPVEWIAASEDGVVTVPRQRQPCRLIGPGPCRDGNRDTDRS
jgi:hypothetical protein